MANAMYPLAKEAILNALVDFDTDDLRVVLVDLADYTYSAAHDFLDDVPGAARVAVSATLTSPTIALGVFDTADFNWPLVTGDQSEALIIYRHTGGADSARRLLVYLDTGVGGIPVTPNGQNINPVVAVGGWFSL